MFPYIPTTEHDEKVMLDELGLKSIDELFADIPADIALKDGLKLPKAKSEIELRNMMHNLASKNLSASDAPCFLGAGAYDHYIPSIIPQIVSRAEFLTSYTPYQPEISQGTLQYIFEFQSLMSRLTGLEVANASLYDSGTAIVEAALMCTSMARKDKIVVSKGVHPDSLEVLKTYCHVQKVELVEVELDDGVTCLKDLEEKVSDDVAAVVVQSPNFYGAIEDVEAAAKIAHKGKKTSFILSTDPISLGILKKPGDMGVDICVGEGQGLGISMEFGGPYLGFFTSTKDYLRKIPGRIVGETTDLDGKRSYVLTLTAREQHIRREKATSNICSNQGLNSLVATIYLSTMGKQGLKEVAVQSHSKAAYLADALVKTGLFTMLSSKPFFKEFAVSTTLDVEKIDEAMTKNNIIGPYRLDKIKCADKGKLLFAVTEKRTKAEMDKLVEVLEGLK